MSVADDFRAAVAQLRSWGFTVVEWSGCYGRSNGGSWSAGRPVGHTNHHYVCALTNSQSYIDGLVQGLADGTTVNWFADVNGVAYLIGTGPMNHAGTGNQSVLDRTRNGQAPPGPASSAGSISGNSHYSGTECQHPGDSTPWPEPMLRVMVAINAAEFLQWGLSANAAIDHYEWTSRKIDMSAGGGPSSGEWAGDQLRYHVGLQMTGDDSGETDLDMSSTASVLLGGQPHVFVVAADGRIFERWPDPSAADGGGWSPWTAGVPGEWSGGLSVLGPDLPQIWGIAADGSTVQTVWSSGDRWNGPVAWTGVEAL